MDEGVIEVDERVIHLDGEIIQVNEGFIGVVGQMGQKPGFC